MYVSEICAKGIFVTFPWWLKNVKSRSKMALFSNERHFEIWFPKKITITFFWSKLSKLHKKDPVLHVATTFSLQQGETRTSLGPIPHPLKLAWMESLKAPQVFWKSCLLFGIFQQKSLRRWVYCCGKLIVVLLSLKKLVCGNWCEVHFKNQPK